MTNPPKYVVQVGYVGGYRSCIKYSLALRAYTDFLGLHTVSTKTIHNTIGTEYDWNRSKYKIQNRRQYSNY